MKKRAFLSIFLALTLMTGFGPAANAAEEPSRWEVTAEKCRDLGLVVNWFNGYEGLMRRYGTDRMLLVFQGQSLLCPLNSGSSLTGPLDGFDAFGQFNADGLAPACQNGKWGVVDLDGRTVVDFLYDTQAEAETAGALAPASQITVDEDALHEGLRRVWDRENDLWGFVNEAGEQAVPCLFDAVGYFDRGYASVKSGDAFGLLKNPLTAPVQTEPPAGEDPPAGLDIAWMDAEKSLYVLGQDNLVYEYIPRETWPGRHGPESKGDNGLYNANGELVVPVQYGYTLPGGPSGYGAGRFAVSQEEGETGTVYTDYLGRTYTEEDLYQAWNPDSPAAYAEPSMDGHDKWGYMDPWTGEKLLPAIYDIAYSFAEGVGVVGVGEDWDTRQYFAIDKEGNKVFDFDTFSYNTRFTEGLMAVQDNSTGKWGFIDPSGTVVIPFEWDSPQEFSEGLSRVHQNGKWGYIGKTGELVIPFLFDSADYAFRNGISLVTYGGKKGILKNPLLKSKTSDWAAEEVKAAAEAGYVTPSCATYQTFTITRAQFAELAVNYVEKKTGKSIAPAPADTFTDTADETVLKAYAAGIVQGMGDGAFGPGRPLTREQLATMLWRAMEKTGLKVGRPADLAAYTDSAQVSSWAADSLAALVGMEVIAGTGAATLSPKDSCTVEQAILLVYRAAETSKAAWGTEYQDALARTTIEGLLIGIPFDQLSPELRAALKPEGEPYDSGVFNPGEEIGQRYTAPGIEVVTSTATEKVLKRVLEGQDKEYLLERYGSEDWQAIYERERGREYVDTVILTGDNYQMVSGLKVGDSGARVRELGYSLSGETYTGSAGFGGSATVYMGNDVVERIEVYDSIGRRIGAFYDP